MPSTRGPGSNDDNDDGSSHPLDELFIVGAKYHEPSAAEREAAALQAEKDAKKLHKQRKKEIDHTRRVLSGGEEARFGRSSFGESIGYDRRNAFIGLAGVVGVAVLLSFTTFVR